MTDAPQREGEPIETQRPLPQAVLRPQRRVSVAWLVPAAALLLAGWLAYHAWSGRGVTVTVQLPEGFGLKPGDEVRYRGITVGEVRRVELANDLDGIVITATLQAEADRLARVGSRFWVVRPQLGLAGVAGLETLVGPRYVAVLPAEFVNGPRRRLFIGLAEPPVVDAVQPGDLEIIIQANQRGTLQRGGPVKYREVRVGTVLSVGLTSDAGAVEARVHIDRAYTQLIRQQTRFWPTGGLEANVGLGGLSLQLQSVEELFTGGLALATPPEAGEVVHTGHRFLLQSEPPDDYLDWQPLAVIGNSMLPPGARLPNPLRARIGWKQGRWISRARSRQGWVLQMQRGLLGPANLLQPDDAADQETIVLEVAGAVLSLDAEPLWTAGGLTMIKAHVSSLIWPSGRQRTASEPEDCLAIGDPTATPLPLAAARLTDQGDDRWTVDPAVSVDDSWHGACVVARADGYLLGMLLVDNGTATVAPLPRADSLRER